MTSWYGNASHITDHLWGKSVVVDSINNAELSVVLCCSRKITIEQTSGCRWFETPWHSRDVTVIKRKSCHVAFRATCTTPWCSMVTMTTSLSWVEYTGCRWPTLWAESCPLSLRSSSYSASRTWKHTRRDTTKRVCTVRGICCTRGVS